MTSLFKQKPNLKKYSELLIPEFPNCVLSKSTIKKMNLIPKMTALHTSQRGIKPIKKSTHPYSVITTQGHARSTKYNMTSTHNCCTYHDEEGHHLGTHRLFSTMNSGYLSEQKCSSFTLWKFILTCYIQFQL